MIEFHNGHKFDFGCASGALAFDGEGWWFEQPWRWTNILRPQDFTIITKTLTFTPRKGNYVWWKPWTCVRPIGVDGVLNAIGLTNPGYEWWLGKPCEHITAQQYKVIVSIAPESKVEAGLMADAFNKVNIVGLQLNVSCPNVEHNNNIDHVCNLVDAILGLTKHPLVVKLSYQDDYLAIAKALDGKVAAIELINTIPFQHVFPGKRSPLSQYGYQGGVSGKPIIHQAREALTKVKESGISTPVISGGGIDSLKEVYIREALGADGWVFGSIFMRKPWLPNQIISKYNRATHKNT